MKQFVLIKKERNLRNQEPHRYKMLLIQSILRALNVEVEEYEGYMPESPFLEKEDVHSTLFARDMIYVINDPVRKLKLILTSSKAASSRKKAQDEMIRAIQAKDDGYSVIEMDAYFEGGNLMYLDGVLLHGESSVCGHYNAQRYSPSKETKAIKKALKEIGITVLGVELDEKQSTEYYYHLDCWMQVINQQLFVLNLNMASPRSQKSILKFFLKDKIVDLGYSKAIAKPFLFNFLTINYYEQTCILADNFPAEIVNKLKETGCIFISPKTFLPTSTEYHQALNEKVRALIAESSNGDYLLTPYQSLIADYDSDDHSVNNLKCWFQPFCDVFSMGRASLHCLTQDIFIEGAAASATERLDLRTQAALFKLPPSKELISIFEKSLRTDEQAAFSLLAMTAYKENGEDQLILFDHFIDAIGKIHENMVQKKHDVFENEEYDPDQDDSFLPPVGFIESMYQKLICNTYRQYQYFINPAIIQVFTEKQKICFGNNRPLLILCLSAASSLAQLKEDAIFELIPFIRTYRDILLTYNAVSSNSEKYDIKKYKKYIKTLIDKKLLYLNESEAEKLAELKLTQYSLDRIQDTGIIQDFHDAVYERDNRLRACANELYNQLSFITPVINEKTTSLTNASLSLFKNSGTTEEKKRGREASTTDEEHTHSPRKKASL